LDKIYEVMRLAIRDGLTTREIADKVNDDESAVRKLRKKGEHLLKMLREQVFPEVAERAGE
jgi:predicted DNA-binding protein YlxM (UPF0122 family)